MASNIICHFPSYYLRPEYHSLVERIRVTLKQTGIGLRELFEPVAVSTVGCLPGEGWGDVSFSHDNLNGTGLSLKTLRRLTRRHH